MKGKAGKFLTAAAVAAAAGVVLKRMRDQQKEQEASRIRSIEEAVMNNRDYGDRQLSFFLTENTEKERDR